ncbi:heterokaryon incompatibility protein-domain-containing protein [Xylaria sp. FL0043]|nr:heterokaryon incompatibility protein-domain-containing protein [Xylaria sp. FL0043]
MSDSSDSEPPKTTNSYDESKRAWWSPCERFNESRSSINDWTTNNTRCKLRYIKFNTCGKCLLCRCIRKAIPLLFDSASEWQKRYFNDDTQFDWGYHSQFGAAYVMSTDTVSYSNPMPIDWIERSDRVEIYPPDSRPRFWKGSSILLQDVPVSSGSDASFELITSCLDRCLEFHPLCRSTELSMPKRVLRIGSDVKDIRLFEPEEEGCHDIKYAALSHCWGKSLPICTTRSTLDERKRRIEWSALPATFCDAVIVCSCLHIEYLWIDALCIIQDDDHDWVVESAKMAQVYRNAHVSISGHARVVAMSTFLLSINSIWWQSEAELLTEVSRKYTWGLAFDVDCTFLRVRLVMGD